MSQRSDGPRGSRRRRTGAPSRVGRSARAAPPASPGPTRGHRRGRRHSPPAPRRCRRSGRGWRRDFAVKPDQAQARLGDRRRSPPPARRWIHRPRISRDRLTPSSARPGARALDEACLEPTRLGAVVGRHHHAHSRAIVARGDRRSGRARRGGRSGRRSSRRRRAALSPGRARESVGQRMQHVDRVDHIQALPQPGRACRPCVQAEPLCVVLRSKGLDRIGRYSGRGRDLG